MVLHICMLDVICFFLLVAGQVKWMTSCKGKGRNSVCLFFFKIWKSPQSSSFKVLVETLAEDNKEMNTCGVMLLKLEYVHESSRACWEADSDSGGVGWGLEFCISNKLPDGAGDASPTTLREKVIEQNWNSKQEWECNNKICMLMEKDSYKTVLKTFEFVIIYKNLLVWARLHCCSSVSERTEPRLTWPCSWGVEEAEGEPTVGGWLV